MNPSIARAAHTSALSSAHSDQSAAYRGAIYAFSQSPNAKKDLTSRHDGADESSNPRPSTVYITSKEKATPSTSQQDVRSMITRTQTSSMSGMNNATRQTSHSREQSPSHVAALLATSRTTPSRAVSGSATPLSKQPSPLGSLEDLRVTEAVDRLPIEDTSSLVKLFEAKQQKDAPVTHSVRYSNKPILSQKHPITGRPPIKSASSTNTPPPQVKKTNKSALTGSTDLRERSQDPRNQLATTASHISVSKSIIPTPECYRSVPEPPVPRPMAKRPSLDGSRESNETFAPEKDVLIRVRARSSPERPTLPKRRTDLTEAAPSIAKLDLTARSSVVRNPEYDNLSPATPSPSRKPTRASDNFVPQLSVNSLANAMVASSLASSRAPSPSKPPPIPPPRRNGKHSLFRHRPSQDQMSRDASPVKGLRQTMREVKSSSEDEGYRHKRGYNKRAHKHHEGDRKRYRTQVTERERKRYEGVWAANKGLLLPPEYQTCVINIAVREIWKRSRLPDDVLEEVWDLVDSQEVGRLEREEFVIGMWLIDQRLKGNKLPSKVPESVWSSVRRLHGVKVHQHRR